MSAIRTAVKVDLDKPANSQPQLHNRWHPDIPTFAKVKPGEPVHIECVDWTGGQIKNNDSADDVLNVDLSCVHYLSGPVEIEGANSGDVLVVEILDVQPFVSQPWGFTGVFHEKNGGGFLDQHYPLAAKAIWDFEGIFASSRHIPGVRFPGLIHPGLMGCAPSHELLATWNKREAELVEEFKASGKKTEPAKLPQVHGAHLGQATGDLAAKIANEGARTIPPREHGGNCDIKNLSRGSKTYMPVYVEGGKFSIGDLHFSQGDGEISFCGAIEMAGIITLKFQIIPNGISLFKMTHPIFFPGPVQPHFGPGRYLTFEGISVDEQGRQHYLDVTIAYRQAVLNCIRYLKQFGYSDYQIYLLLSTAPVEGHVAGVVDSKILADFLIVVPNACVTLGVPVDIFDFDILPRANGLKKLENPGSCPISDYK